MEMVDAITSQYRSNHLSFANLALETQVATRTVDIARPLAVARVRGIIKQVWRDVVICKGKASRTWYVWGLP